jgi:hypothetical protein
MANLSPVAREQLALIGKFDEKTTEQWQALMKSLADTGVLELMPDVMQADLIVRAYQRSLQLDQVEYETLQSLLGAVESAVTAFQKEQQGKLDQYFEKQLLNAHDYRQCCNALVEACNARLSNVHNLLSVVSKAKFQNLQFFNKGMALAGFSRVARKSYGAGGGHDMERLAKGLSEERDELGLTEPGKVIAQDSALAAAVKDAEFTEIDEALQDGMLNDIRTPAPLAGGSEQ